MAELSEGPAGDCVKLQSSEGEIFEVSIEVAEISRTLSIMLAGNISSVAFEYRNITFLADILKAGRAHCH